MRFDPWTCPTCGEVAEGVEETVFCLALLVFDETGQADYFGETKVHWNSQRPVRDEDGRRILTCESAHSWPATRTED